MQKSVINNSVFIPKSGIEQPFMRDRPRFKENHKEFEPIHCMNVRIFLLHRLSLS